MRYWSKKAAAIDPYVPGEQPRQKNVIKLNTNESPYPPSPKVLEAVKAAVPDLRLYPDPNASALRQALARRHGLTEEYVFAGNGSDEVLALVFLAYFEQDRPVRCPDITYSFYEVYASLFSVPLELIPLNEDFTVPLDKLAGSPGGILLANPNAPTGIGVSAAEIETLLQKTPDSVVVVDEAYAEYGAESCVPLISRYPNLLVVKTFSKSHSLAGLRVGYAMGQPELVEALQRVKNCFNSYPLDRLALAGALASIEDEEYCQRHLRMVQDNRAMTVLALEDMGFTVLPSQANFIFVRHPRFDGGFLQKKLRERDIIVRHFSKARLQPWMRVSIGSREEMNAFLRAVHEIIREEE